MDTTPDLPLDPPPRPAVMRLAARIAFLLLIVTGLAFLVIGALDFLGGRAIDARLLGALNLAAAAVWLSASVGLHYRTIFTLALVLSGGTLSVVYGFYYAWQWNRFDRTDVRVLVLGLWLIVVGFLTLVVLARSWQSYGITERTRRRLGAGRFGIPVLAIVGTMGALFQFWYNAAYGPSALPPNVVINATLTPISQQDGGTTRAYSVDVEMSNAGQSRVQVLASWFNVSVMKATPVDGEQSYASRVGEIFREMPYVLAVQPHRGTRLMTVAEPQTVASGELLTRGWGFEPGESSHVQFLTFARPGDGDVLHLGVGLAVARGSRLTLDDPAKGFGCNPQIDPVDVMSWTTSEPSLIRTFSTPKVTLSYAWETSEDGLVGFEQCFGVDDDWHPVPLPGEAPDPILDTLQQEYGLTNTYAESDLSLWPEIHPEPSSP
ncbi:MAG TPA: hypothetical protein VH440_04225 [Candidatus Limnocylindrales bacterium]|jgi:hypothetical protein